MRSWLTLGALLFVAYGGLGLSACADSVYLAGGAPEDGVDLGPPDLGPPPPDMGPVDMGPADTGPVDMGPVDMGPDLGPCPVGMATCCGDGIVQASEECEPNLPIGNPDRCPVNPSDCMPSGQNICIEGTNNCTAHCVARDPFRASIQTCPPVGP